MYKDIGRQGLVSVRPDTPYRRRFDDFVAKKNRLAADQWGSDGIGVAEVTQPVQDLIAREFPDFDPYPWGRFDWVRTLLLNITIAQPLAHEYASLFRGLDDSRARRARRLVRLRILRGPGAAAGRAAVRACAPESA